MSVRARPLAEQVGSIVDLLPLIVKNLRIGRLLENVRPGLGISQLLVLHALERAPADGAPMGELADEVGVSVPTTNGLVGRLVREGLVERCAHPQDRRVVLVALTSEGRTVARRAVAYLAEMMGKLLSDLEETEREGLAHAFESVYELSVRIQEEQRRIVSLA
jgi:DNA-binding MarR family transcriptional regulator